jgi:cytochrome P450
VNRAFTPRTVDRLRPEIVALVDGLLDGLPEGEPVDVMNHLAFPLPVAVIGHLLGVPSEDWRHFREVMGRATVLLEPVISPEELGPAIEAQAELEAYFQGLVTERRARPGDDLVSGLIAVQEGTDKLTELELIGIAILIFGAGFETTTNLIGNGLLALLTHPGEMDRLRDHPGLLRSAVDELLRYDSPVQFDGRLVLEDAVVAGVPLKRHEEIITILGAANRDPAHFSDPDTLDLGRDEGPPLSFAAGIHFCLGAALARAEGQVFFGRLLERFESIELAIDAPVFRNRITLRGLTSLPVVVRS